MTTKPDGQATLLQSVHEAPIKIPRPKLDWGDMEPDLEWEELYHRGLVNPPYVSPEVKSAKIRAILEEMRVSPLLHDVKPQTYEEFMCSLGRCQCSCCSRPSL